MFEITVTTDTPDTRFQTTVDMLDEFITSKDELLDFVADQLEDQETDGCEVSIGDLSENISLEAAFEYIEYANNNTHFYDIEGLIAAAIYLDIPGDQLEEAFYGEYDSEAQFAMEFFESTHDSLPDWVVVDWEATYASNLRFDFVNQNGFFFRNI